MKSLLYFAAALIICCSFSMCSTKAASDTRLAQYVTVGSDGQFHIGDSVYQYIGTNMWYAALLASEGIGGDRERLRRELDTLQQLGITNLRILVGGDGRTDEPSHIRPVLQPLPGVLNDTLLRGLDYLLLDLERRGMKAVLYLNNAWEWSGGYGAYLEWAGRGPCPDPARDGYREYVSYVAQFVLCDSAKAMAANHIRAIVSRVNTLTGKPYTQSPAIMAWQIANEPRPFAADSLHKQAFAKWIARSAALIKSLDHNHLVSTGSEGRYGCEDDIDLWTAIHSDPNIDYALIHLWPYNWWWVRDSNLTSGLDTACALSRRYIAEHAERMALAGKPLVLEEFGYPRDGKAIDIRSTTRARDRFYDCVLSLVGPDRPLAGCNFWGWGGFAQPAHIMWQPGDPFTGDPAQEPQGLYSVFASDTSTLRIIRSHLTFLYRNKY